MQYFRHVEEIEWAIELALEYGKPVAATMCPDPAGDAGGVPLQECAVRMARAGAHLIGVNCLYDPFMVLDIMKQFKEGLDKHLKPGEKRPYLMCQPLGYRTPDSDFYGWVNISDYPYCKLSEFKIPYSF